jgi:hypothetical protein
MKHFHGLFGVPFNDFLEFHQCQTVFHENLEVLTVVLEPDDELVHLVLFSHGTKLFLKNLHFFFLFLDIPHKFSLLPS